MTKYALLDYDGFICKAFYAATKNSETDIEQAFEILDNLTNTAIDKANKYFNTECRVLKFTSAHTFKKDIYPDYKAKRTKNELLGYFRDVIISEYNCIRKLGLEADDLICSHIYNGIREDSLVFSDDKDMVDFSQYLCGINLTEEPIQLTYKDRIKAQSIHYLKGDKEDNITGIPNVGQAKAEKIYEKIINSSIDCWHSIINEYKEYDVSLSNCIKNLYLLAPVWVKKNQTPYEAHGQLIGHIYQNVLEVYFNG